MIIKAFSEYLKIFNEEIPPVIVLSRWLKDKLSNKPLNNVERIIHKEICLVKNKLGLFVLVGKSDSGRILLESLYNYALSYEQCNFSRWVNDLRASDFNK
jgi:hypothetical protein